MENAKALTDDAEILGKAVSDEDATAIDEETELLVHNLERRQGVPRHVRVEIANWKPCLCQLHMPRNEQRRMRTLNPRELCQIVDDDLARVDMVVDERHALLWTIASQDRNTGQ